MCQAQSNRLFHLSVNGVQALMDRGEATAPEVDAYVKAWNEDGKHFTTLKRLGQHLSLFDRED